jgi:hypothetical protein
MKAIKYFEGLEPLVEWSNKKGVNMLHSKIVPIIENGNSVGYAYIVDKFFIDEDNKSKDTNL